MKPSVAPYARPLYAMRIECANGTVVRLVEYPYDVRMSGMLYRAGTGYQFTGIEKDSGLSPTSVDLKALIGVSPEITIASIQSGIFDRAEVFFFKTDWANPVEDEEQIAKCLFGKTQITDDEYRAECMTLIDLLNSVVGANYPSLCPLVFGGQEYGGCKVDVVSLRVTGTITSVVDNFEFADSSRTEDDDYFGAGNIWFTSGPNTGIAAQRVKAYTQAGGVIETTEPFPYLPQVGDEYIMEPGCRKRLVDCRDKWDNVPRRRGFDYLPGTRFLNKIGGE